MTNYPGDLTAEEQDARADELREKASDRWGEERADAISDALRRLAIAVGRLDRLQLPQTDAPAFYLQDMAERPQGGHPH